MARKKSKANQAAANPELVEVPTTEAETVVAIISGEATTVETSPIPTEPTKKPKKNARPYVPMAKEALEKGLYTRKEFITAIMDAFPEIKKGGVETFVTDLKNPKYCYFKPRVVVVNADGKLIFAESVQPQEEEAVAEEVAPPVAEQEMGTENVASA